MLRRKPGTTLTYIIALLLLLTQHAFAADGAYTIQAGTYDYSPYAVEQLYLIRDKAGDKGKGLAHLRVVKFRDIFAVRVGKYPDSDTAKRHLPLLRTLYPDAFILAVKSEQLYKAFEEEAEESPSEISVDAPRINHERAKALIERDEYEQALDLLAPYAAEPERYPTIVSDYLVLLTWEERQNEAIGLYESLPSSFPRRLYLLLNMGRAYYDEGAFQDAAGLYKAALDQSAADEEARKGFIFSSIRASAWPDAQIHLEGLLPGHPDPVPLAVETITILHSEERVQEMVEVYYLTGRDEDGTDKKARITRRALLAKLPDETKDPLMTRLMKEGAPEDRSAIDAYLLRLVLDKRYGTATRAIDATDFDITPLKRETQAWIAWAYFKGDDVKKSKSHYRTLLASNPGYLPGELGLSYCLASEGSDLEAMTILDRVVGRAPDNREIHFARAFAHEQAGRLLSAIEEYNTILTLAPENPTALRLKAQAMSDLGMTTQAIEAATRDLPNDRELLDNLRGDQVVDYYEWGETEQALHMLAPLLEDGTNLRARFDHIATLVKHGDHGEAVEAYEELLEEEISPPLWLREIIVDSYSTLGKPSTALALHDKALEEAPNSFRNRMGRFYALQDLRRWAEAEELLNALDDEEPAVYWSGDHARPNWNKAEIAIARGWFHVSQDQLKEGEGHFRALSEKAPANSEIRSALAHIYHWRGWPRRAVREFTIIESRDPGNAGILTGKISALNAAGYREEAREAAAALLEEHPKNRHVRQLVRELTVEEMNELNVELVYTSDEDGTREILAETTLSHHPSLRSRLYGFLLWKKTWDDSLESYFRRVGLGIDYLVTPSWRVRQHFAVNTNDGGDFGSFTLVDYHPDDHWRFELSHDSFTTDIDMRARVFDIDASTTVLDATYRESDWRSYALSLSTMRFSDDNTRNAALLHYEQGLWTAGDWKMRLMLDLSTSRNSLDTAPYFNPESDLSFSATHMTEHTIRRDRNSSLLQRLYLTLGTYKQSQFSNSFIGAVRYEQEHNFSDVNALLFGASAAQNVYDGEGVNSYSLSLNYTGRF